MSVCNLSRDEFFEEYGRREFPGMLAYWTPSEDTEIVLDLLGSHPLPNRILEIGAAWGHMTANLLRFSPSTAKVIALGIVGRQGWESNPEQEREMPPVNEFCTHALALPEACKLVLEINDSLRFDFTKHGPLDFVFVDGAHDYDHVYADTRNAWAALAPGGFLVWHDFKDTDSLGLNVQKAVQEFAAQVQEPVYHVAGSWVAFAQKNWVLVEEAPQVV